MKYLSRIPTAVLVGGIATATLGASAAVYALSGAPVSNQTPTAQQTSMAASVNKAQAKETPAADSSSTTTPADPCAGVPVVDAAKAGASPSASPSCTSTTTAPPTTTTSTTSAPPKQAPAPKAPTATRAPAPPPKKPANPAPPVGGETGGASAVEMEVFRLVNVERGKQGLAPLKMMSCLNTWAKKGSANMSSTGNFAHQELRPVGAACGGYAGENIGMGTTLSAAAAMDMWMNSPGHRANILNPKYTHFGVSFVTGGRGTYATQLFLYK